MNWKYHSGLSFIIALVILYFSSQHFTLTLIPMAQFAFLTALSALLPDLDLYDSKASQFIIPITILGIAAAVFYFLGITPTSFIIALVALVGAHQIYQAITGGHRGHMHRWWFALVFSIPAYFLYGPLFAIAITLGYQLHLIEDAIYDRTGFGGGSWKK